MFSEMVPQVATLFKHTTTVGVHAFEIQINDVTVAAVDDLEKTVNKPNAIVAKVSNETSNTIPGSHRLASGPKNRMTCE